ncbi:TonB-dependent siderophore receptor [Massilia sp. Root351]|uniref:TonB-dependent receptor plug domain-containing protein n=1 Tax=Massilia sp. Root351 TaxID=1736522 RepID=UPI000ACC38E1|nr:TonB-dependent receptor [Massilia sp. Root351]
MALKRCLTGVALSLFPHAALAYPVQDNLTGMSLEELGAVRITSVSKREEPLADAPAAVYVISAADLRRSGAASLVEALRLAPNLQVMQVSSGTHVVTARGFAGDNNKLLVLVDGRSAYTPLFAGVFWDAQDVPLDDIERIEVVSGPGGTLWGTNAVNGVINVITRPASATQGGRVALSGGNARKDGTARYGAALGENGAYRIYGKAFSVQNTETASGKQINDAWHKAQAGFRADWRQGADGYTVQGDAYRARKGHPLPGSIIVTGLTVPLGELELGGGNLLARWTRQLGGSTLSAQAYYDRTERDVPPFFNETLDILDLQTQYTMAPAGRHALAFGAQYRHADDQLQNSVYFGFLPARQKSKWTSVFAQDEVALGDAWRLTLGLRAERNGYTGTEFLPNARLAWKVGADSMLWGAVSRTVRAPSRLDRDPVVPGVPPHLLVGGPDFQSEVARFFELGIRSQAGPDLLYSINLYRALYDDLHSQEQVPGQLKLKFANGLMGASRGLEAWASWQLTPSWRLRGAVTAQHTDTWLKPGVVDLGASLKRTGRDPAYTASLRSSWQMSGERELDVALRRVGALSDPDVPAYTAVDMRFGWKLRPALSLSLTGNNLFGGGHGEVTEVAYRTHVRRSVALELVAWF